MASVDIEPELRLKLFLYFCSEESRYVATYKKQHNCCQLSKVTSLFELITADKENLILELIDSVKNDPLCARRETILFVLAALTRNARTEKIKVLAYDKVLEVCNTTEELFLFLKYAHCLNKNYSHGIRRIVLNYYLKKEPMDLFRIVTHCNSYFGWTHKDVLSLVHIKSIKKSAQDIIFTYVMKDFDEAKKIVDGLDKKENSSVINDVLNKLEKFDTLKHCQSDEQAVTLVTENNYKVQQIPTTLLKSQIVWECLIPSLEISELLPELLRLNRGGFLKSNNPNSALNKVVEILSDTKKCIASKIQPAQALIYLKTFERGKPIDPQRRDYIYGVTNPDEEKKKDIKLKKKDPIYYNPPKNNAIISALYKLLQHSFKNVQATGRRFLITIDPTQRYMEKLCFTNKAVTCFEAAVVIAFSLVRAEKDVTVAVFNGATINLVSIDKNMTYAQALQKIKETSGNHVVLNSTFNWAIKNNKQIDVFLNLMYSADSMHRVAKDVRNSENIIVALKRYRQKVHLPNTKMINVSIGGRKLAIADGSSHVLDICGFDQYVPKMIEACCKGVLQ